MFHRQQLKIEASFLTLFLPHLLFNLTFNTSAQFYVNGNIKKGAKIDRPLHLQLFRFCNLANG